MSKQEFKDYWIKQYTDKHDAFVTPHIENLVDDYMRMTSDHENMNTNNFGFCMFLLGVMNTLDPKSKFNTKAYQN